MSDSSSSWELAQGDEIDGGLIAMKLLGGGSAYEACLAFGEKLYAPVVVKVIRPDQVADSATMRGLERECDMLQLLNHPAIVRGFRANLSAAKPYVVLENLDGPRLSSLIRRHGPLSPQQLLPLGIELCSAVHYLGQLDVVHLDIKPSNIIMGAPARLIDLSVARSRERAARLTSPIGTDAYMAPEQCLAGTGGTQDRVRTCGASGRRSSTHLRATVPLIEAAPTSRPTPRCAGRNSSTTRTSCPCRSPTT